MFSNCKNSPSSKGMFGPTFVTSVFRNVANHIQEALTLTLTPDHPTSLELQPCYIQDVKGSAQHQTSATYFQIFNHARTCSYN